MVLVVVSTRVRRYGRVEHVERRPCGVVLQLGDDAPELECADEGEGGHVRGVG